jgi:hypothetical protein
MGWNRELNPMLGDVPTTSGRTASVGVNQASRIRP